MELKPCPFCGGKAHVGEMKKAVGFERWSVACINRRCIAYKLHNPFVSKYLSLFRNMHEQKYLQYIVGGLYVYKLNFC